MFLSFFQYTGPLVQEARLGLGLAVMELVLVPTVLVPEDMVQDLEVLAVELGAMEVLRVLGPLELGGLELQV